MEAAAHWYSHTEQKIYSKARESIKISDKETRQPTPAEIEAKEEELRQQYYRLEKPEHETEIQDRITEDEYFKRMEEVKKRMDSLA